MIKYTRQGNDLKNYVKHVAFIDTDQYSKNYFRLLDFPDRLYVGKNSFKIAANGKKLVRGSKIYIDVVDSNGNVLYHEVLNVVNKDQSRSVVVYIYTDTPTGDATIYVAGRIESDPRTGVKLPYSISPADSNYKDVPNIMWIGKSMIVTNKQNTSEVFFTNEPKIIFSETLAQFTEISGSNRLTQITSETVVKPTLLSTVSRTLPTQFDKKSVFEDAYIEGADRIRKLPLVTGGGIESQNSTQLPEYNSLTIIESTDAVFSRTMTGGTIEVRGIDVSGDLPPDDISAVTVLDYSASIVKVISPTQIRVDRPFSQQYKYKSENGTVRSIKFDRFVGQSTWSVDYYDNASSLTGTNVSESFVKLEFLNVEPATGTVDRVNVAYKPVGAIGEFSNLGDYRIQNQNFLTDPNTFELTLDSGLVEKEIGFPETEDDMNSYWAVEEFNDAQDAVIELSENISNGLTIRWNSPSGSNDDYVAMYPSNYPITTAENTEYKLSFAARFDSPNGYSDIDPYIDVYINGTDIVSDIIPQRYSPNPIDDVINLGTHIGTVTTKRGRRQEVDMYFIAKSRAEIRPYFVCRSGHWDIGQISVSPRREIGFSPNHVKMKIPLSQLTKSAELILEFKYLNSDGIEGNLDTKVFGLIFTGSDGGVTDFRDIAPDGIISGSGLGYNTYTASVAGNKEIPSYDVQKRFTIDEGGAFGLYVTSASFSGSNAYTASESNLYSGVLEFTVAGYADTPWTRFGTSFNVDYTIMDMIKDYGTPYTASRNVVGGMYEIQTMVFAVSGSLANPNNLYSWGGVTRGRFFAPNISTGGNVVLYSGAYSTGSLADNQLSAFGSPSGDVPNSEYEGVFRINSELVTDNQSALTVNYELLGLASLSLGTSLDVYYVSHCRVMKFEWTDFSG